MGMINRCQRLCSDIGTYVRKDAQTYNLTSDKRKLMQPNLWSIWYELVDLS